MHKIIKSRLLIRAHTPHRHTKLIYRGFKLLHNRGQILSHLREIRWVWILLIIGFVDVVYSIHAYAQYLTSSSAPNLNKVTESNNVNCQTIFQNPAGILGNHSGCYGVQVSQLFQIQGLFLYESSLELPKIGLAFGLRTLKWTSYQRLEWLTGYAISKGNMKLGIAIHLHQDQFPAPYRDFQKIGMTLGGLITPSESLTIGILSENILQQDIGKNSEPTRSELPKQRRATFASEWRITPFFFVRGGIRLDPSFDFQSEGSIGWMPANSVMIQIGQRSTPRLMYGNIRFRTSGVRFGFSSFRHIDLGHTLSVDIAWMWGE